MAAVAMGVYVIRNTVTGKCYVGSSVNIARRWAGHRWGLNAGRSNCRRLQATWSKYGEEFFAFEIVELVDDIEKLVGREQSWLDQTKAFEVGYNCRPQADGWRGQPRSKEWRAAIGLALKGRKKRPPSPEHRAKISAARKRYLANNPTSRAAAVEKMMEGRRCALVDMPAEERARRSAKMSADRKGKKQGPRSDAAKGNIAAACNLAWQDGRSRGRTGQKVPKAEIEKRSAALRDGYASGRLQPRAWTAEEKEKRRISSTGRKHSAESRAKMSRVQTGREVSDAARLKLSASTKAHWAALTDAERAAISAERRGREPSGETREKLRQAMTGRTYSPETIERMRVAARRRWQTRRESGVC